MIYNQAAEEALIGIALVHGDRPDILPSTFYKEAHRWIWEAILQVEIPDLITVTAQLRKNGHKIDNIVTKIALQEAEFWNAEKYAEQIKELAVRRRMVELCSKAVNNAHDETKNTNDIVAEIIGGFDKLSTVKETSRSIGLAASDSMDIILKRIEMRHKGEEIEVGFDTGVGYINRNLKGLKRKWLVYLAGSPGVGKSMLAFQMSLVFANQAPGDYIALEMDEEALMYRAYSMRTGDNPTNVEFGNVEADDIVSAYTEFDELPFNVFCPPRLTIQELKAYIAKQKADRGIGWVVVDYVSLLDTPTARSSIEEDEILSAELRKIALEFDVLLLGLDSITKAGATGLMSLGDIRGSFTKQHDADVSFGMSKYNSMNGRFPDVDTERMRDCRLLGVLKDRHRGCADMTFPLEYKNGLIADLVEDVPWIPEDYTV